MELIHKILLHIKFIYKIFFFFFIPYQIHPKQNIYKVVRNTWDFGRSLGLFMQNNNLVIEALAQSLKSRNDDVNQSFPTSGRGRRKQNKKESNQFIGLPLVVMLCVGLKVLLCSLYIFFNVLDYFVCLILFDLVFQFRNVHLVLDKIFFQHFFFPFSFGKIALYP